MLQKSIASVYVLSLEKYDPCLTAGAWRPWFLTEIESCVYFDYNVADILLIGVCLSIKISEFDGCEAAEHTWMYS